MYLLGGYTSSSTAALKSFWWSFQEYCTNAPSFSWCRQWRGVHASPNHARWLTFFDAETCRCHATWFILLIFYFFFYFRINQEIKRQALRHRKVILFPVCGPSGIMADVRGLRLCRPLVPDSDRGAVRYFCLWGVEEVDTRVAKIINHTRSND